MAPVGSAIGRIRSSVLEMGWPVEHLGDITQIDLTREGDAFKKGAVIGSVESVKAVSDVFAPVSGKVVKVNDPLKDSPENLNEDCYDEGWMVTLEVSDPAELDALMDAATYTKYVKEHE